MTLPIQAEKGTALISGASGGIGEALAWEFARDGYGLVLVARRQGKLDTLAQELTRKHGIPCRALAVDLARPDGPWQAVDAVRKAGIAVDILVNNAGVGLSGPFAGTDMQRELDLLQLNVTSLVVLTKLLLDK